MSSGTLEVYFDRNEITYKAPDQALCKKYFETLTALSGGFRLGT